LLKYSLKSLYSRKTISSLFILAFVVVLSFSLLSVNIFSQIKEGFYKVDGDYDIVVGPKGSSTALVMSSLFFSADPIGRIDYKYYEDLKARNDLKLVIPLAMGDNYRGANIVGTTTELLASKKFKEGGMFSEDKAFEAVIGVNVATHFGLKVGDVLISSHGMGLGMGLTSGHEEGKYILTGILARTNTAYDNTFFTGLISIFDIHGISPSGNGAVDTMATMSTTDKAVSTTEATPVEDERGVTAILIRSGNMSLGNSLLAQFKTDTIAQAVNPTAILRQLLSNIDLSKKVAQLLTYIIIAQAVLVIAIMSFLMFESNKKEVHILRFIGLSRWNIVKFVFYQNIFILFIGTVLSGVVSRLALSTANVISETMGIVIDSSKFYPDEFKVAGLILLICLLPVVIQLRKLLKEMLKS
jgi:putative ABC transport system permease protein